MIRFCSSGEGGGSTGLVGCAASLTFGGGGSPREAFCSSRSAATVWGPAPIPCNSSMATSVSEKLSFCLRRYDATSLSLCCSFTEDWISWVSCCSVRPPWAIASPTASKPAARPRRHITLFYYRRPAPPLKPNLRERSFLPAARSPRAGARERKRGFRGNLRPLWGNAALLQA